MVVRKGPQIILGAATAMAILSTACTAATAGAVELSCTVDGAQYVGLPSDVCAAFQTEIDAALNITVKPVSAFSATGNGDAIDVSVRVLKRGGIVAQVNQRKNGTMHRFPEVAIDVMDRPLRLNDVETLAAEIAKQLSRDSA
jgi:nitrous oxidase accessory protein NosD